MELKVYIDGKYYDKENAKISVYDHGFLYGDGVFEGIRCYNGRVFRLSQHLDRLLESARAICLEIGMDKEQLRQAVKTTLRLNHFTDAYIRLVVSRGKGDLGLDPNKCAKASVVVITDKIQLYPEQFYQKGLEIVTVTTRRNSPDVLNPAIKSLNYLNNILAKIEVHRAGALEGLMLNQRGMVSECTGDNIFIVKNDELLTPAADQGILVGVTRGAAIDIAHEFAIPVRECALSLLDVYNADECFLTGTGAEVIPVVKVDGRKINCGSPGEITRRIIKRFRELVATGGDPLEE